MWKNIYAFINTNIFYLQEGLTAENLEWQIKSEKKGSIRAPIS